MQKTSLRGTALKTKPVEKEKIQNFAWLCVDSTPPFSTLFLSLSRFLCVSLSSLIRSVPQTERGPQLNTIHCCSSRSALLVCLFLSIQERKRKKEGTKGREKMQQWRPENAAMTFDEVSMERSKSFVKALQELKNLRPQLYSAAEYCEKSYLHNEQKQMVLDNLKDYAVRALVNAVDHLGTVAYKLTDLFEQQALDVSTVELKISCLNQRILTCQTYVDKEGIRQQQMLSTTPKHHKHYILPNSVNQKVQRNQLSQTQPKPRPLLPGTPASKTLSWHLASDANSTTNGASSATIGCGDFKASILTSEVFHLLDPEEAASSLPLSTHVQSSSWSSTLQPFGVKDTLEVPKPLSAFRSFDNPHRDLIRAPVRSKSMLSVFFAKTKASKPKKTCVH